MKEEWKTAPGHPDYDVSNHGRVRSWKTMGYSKEKLKNPVIIKGTITNNGYNRVFADEKYSTVHRLVLIAFGGLPPTSKHECCHNDGNKLNNHLSNLRWGTRQENVADMIKHGTNQRGENHCRAKLKASNIPEIRDLRKNKKTFVEIGKLYNVNPCSISAIVKGESWTHIE